MEIKKCCYMDRDCTPACVAYNVSEEINTGAEEIGMIDMHCSRLFLEFAEVMYNNTPVDFTGFEDEGEF
ncbi:MAG: hypothetical protein SCH70_02675 [Candidatus Methanoperedens sp.]|nr:hypothetical protein [Candidatus Methanoperedens sp.]